MQLVMYPILDLTRHKQDLHWYLRGLEEVLIKALADTSGLQGERIEVGHGVELLHALHAAVLLHGLPMS
jgi:lipoyl(octanoyl) transferase